MKATPQEGETRQRRAPGALSRDGYLGEDDRHIHDIVSADEATLARIGRAADELAARMEYFMNIAFDCIEDSVLVDGNWEVEYLSFRGFLPCPFRHAGRYRKGVVRIRNRAKNMALAYSPLNIHLIRDHHFFEGHGSPYRLEPVVLAEVLFV